MTPGIQLVEAGTVTQFTATGITTSTVDIALVDCANIDTDGTGTSTFPNSTNPGGTGNVAELGLTGTAAGIEINVVNGASVTGEQYKNNVAVNNGTVTFSAINNGTGCYVAVVFADADNDDNVDLGTNNQPTEAFGNSGDINVVPPEAADNLPINGQVLQNSALANVFIATSPTTASTYYYDTNDEFLLAGTPNTVLTIEQFEARLSPGDGVTGTYRNQPANQSSFLLADTAPVAPTGVVAQTPGGATNGGKAGVEVEFNDSATATVVKYDIFRATAIQPTITGTSVSCPTIASGAYSDIGDVADKTSGFPYEFLDSTTTVPATGTNPSYCYYVVAVDATGDVGPASAIDGPQVATAGDTSGAPEFTSAASSASSIGGTAITVTYDEAIQCSSVDPNGSGYSVTTTNGGVTTARTVASAVCDSGFTTGTDTDTQVVITISGAAIAAGDTVVVTAKNGADTNTVLDTTNVAQPVGDAVQTTATDTTAPAFSSASTTDGDTELTVVYTEALSASSVDADGSDYTITVDGTVLTDAAFNATVSGGTVTLTLEPGNFTTGQQLRVDKTDGSNDVLDVNGNPQADADFIDTTVVA